MAWWILCKWPDIYFDPRSKLAVRDGFPRYTPFPSRLPIWERMKVSPDVQLDQKQQGFNLKINEHSTLKSPQPMTD